MSYDSKDDPSTAGFSEVPKSSAPDSRKFRRALTVLILFLSSLIRIACKLRAVWGIFFVLGLSITIFAGQRSNRHPYLSLLAPGLTGFFVGAVFSRRDKILFRGVGDAVYLTVNNFFAWHSYRLGPEEVCAFGGDWHEIFHVSESIISERLRNDKSKGLSLKEAKLFRVKDQKTVYAILLNTRHGIPDRETLWRIWKVSPFDPPEANLSELDRFRPGGDLRSVQYWPVRFRSEAVTVPPLSSIRQEIQTEASEAAHKDYLLFIAQDTLEEIREVKKGERDTAFSFLLTSGGILGLNALFPKVENSLLRFTLASAMAAIGVFTIYLLFRLHGALIKARRRISTIFDDPIFTFAFRNNILEHQKNYTSFWKTFWGFTFPYILMVLSVTLVILFFLFSAESGENKPKQRAFREISSQCSVADRMRQDSVAEEPWIKRKWRIGEQSLQEAEPSN